ncbi:MAG: hydantoin racemase [Prevotella sp.]|nr:MAG: hydantoin racemase [Prevotella sp.]
MVFGGWKGELLVVIGCGTNRLDCVKLPSNVT